MLSENLKKACDEAEKLRKKLGAGLRPARELLVLCNSQGILVLRMDMGEGISGAYVRSRRRKVSIILINTTGRSLHHQRFTLAHELGHCYLHQEETGMVEQVNDSGDEDRGLEQEASLFAAALLVPLKELRRLLRERGISRDKVSDRMVIELSQQFGVSHHVILRRLRAIGASSQEEIERRIRETDWNGLWKRYAPEAHKDTIPGHLQIDWRPQGVSDETARRISQFPKVYRDMAFKAYEDGRITEGKLAELLSLPDKETVVSELRPLLRPELAEEQKETEKVLRQHLDPGKDA